jgi:hypothetical protein
MDGEERTPCGGRGTRSPKGRGTSRQFQPCCPFPSPRGKPPFRAPARKANTQHSPQQRPERQLGKQTHSTLLSNAPSASSESKHTALSSATPRAPARKANTQHSFQQRPERQLGNPTHSTLLSNNASASWETQHTAVHSLSMAMQLQSPWPCYWTELRSAPPSRTSDPGGWPCNFNHLGFEPRTELRSAPPSRTSDPGGWPCNFNHLGKAKVVFLFPFILRSSELGAK